MIISTYFSTKFQKNYVISVMLDSFSKNLTSYSELLGYPSEQSTDDISNISMKGVVVKVNVSSNHSES